MRAPVFFNIKGNLLNKLIRQAIKEGSVSLADTEIVGLFGVNQAGDPFPIENLQVKLIRRQAGFDMSGQHTTIPAGKIRLAAVDGVAR